MMTRNHKVPQNLNIGTGLVGTAVNKAVQLCGLEQMSYSAVYGSSPSDNLIFQ